MCTFFQCWPCRRRNGAIIGRGTSLKQQQLLFAQLMSSFASFLAGMRSTALWCRICKEIAFYETHWCEQSCFLLCVSQSNSDNSYFIDSSFSPEIARFFGGNPTFIIVFIVCLQTNNQSFFKLFLLRKHKIV